MISNPQINPRWLVGVVVVAGLSIAGYSGAKHLQAASRASAEAKLEEPEIQECKARLAVFYDAWKRYRSDHKGQEPPNLESMIPKYIKDPNLLICPTALRLAKSHIHLEQGELILPNNGGKYPETYEFKWLSAGYPLFLKQKGDQLPLIVCTAHRDAAYIAAYKTTARQEDFDAAHRDSLIGSVRDAQVYAARRNGKIEAIDTAKE